VTDKHVILQADDVVVFVSVGCSE